MELTNRSAVKSRYRWVIIGAMFVMVFVCLGFCSSNKGVYLSAITQALDIKRSLFSINDSCRYITTAVVNLFFGAMIARFGARKLIGAGFLSLIVSAVLYATASNIFLFYLGGCFLGMGLSWTTTTMVGYVVNCWCKEHKGTIMGFVLAANGLGGALAAQIVTPIIYQEGNAFGYRNAYWLVAAILLVVGILVVALIRDVPKGMEGEIPKKKAKNTDWEGISYAEAVKKPYFYAAAVCIFLTGAALQGINGISAAQMTDSGLDAGYMATVMSAHSLALTAAKFLSGFVHDRIGLRKTLLLCQLASVVAFVALALVSPGSTGMVLAMIYGVISSFAMPLETIMLPLIAGDLFGQKSFAKIMGIFVSVNTAGYALGSPIANFTYDLLGSYQPVLFVMAGLMLAVMLAFQSVLTAAQKERSNERI